MGFTSSPRDPDMQPGVGPLAWMLSKTIFKVSGPLRLHSIVLGGEQGVR